MSKFSKEILVTGGSGFLGSYVSDVLSDAGLKVTIFDIKKSPWIKKNQKMVIGDLLDEGLVKKIVKNKFAVFHFAGISDIEKASSFPISAIKNNILATSILLDQCSKSKVKRFIFASSIYVYSDKGGIYRSTKQACELLIENFSTLRKLDYTILRFGSIYGRRSEKDNFIHSIIYSALKNKILIRNGNDDDIRDYIHVIDAAKASLKILEKEFRNKIIILSGSQTVTIKELIKMIGEILNKKLKVKYIKKINNSHYSSTPYHFDNNLPTKLIQDKYIDLGQGILDTIKFINDLERN